MTELPHAHSLYDYDGRQITLMYSDEREGRWEVYDGGTYLGIVFETHDGSEGAYAARLPGHEDMDPEVDTADGWRAAVNFLIHAV